MRRTLRIAAGTAASLALSGCFSWTHTGAGPTGTYNNPSEDKLTADTIGQVQEIWTAPTGKVLTSGDRVIVFDHFGPSVRGYDAATGTEVWSAPGGLAAIEGATVYVTEGAFSNAGGTPTSRSAIVARSLATGEEIPALTERFPDDSMLTAMLDPALGSRYHAWTISTVGWDRHGERIYTSKLRLTDRQTGVEHTFLPDRVDEHTGFVPWIDERAGRLYYSPTTCCAADMDRDLLKAVDLATGEVVWSRSDLLHNNVGAEGERLYVVGPQLRVLDAATGETVWSGAAPANTGNFAVSDGTVYIESDGTLTAYRECGEVTCSPLWTAQISNTYLTYYRLIAAGELVYTAADEGEETRVNAYPADGCDAPTCEPVASWLVSGDLGASIVVAEGRIYVSTSTGVHAFGLPT